MPIDYWQLVAGARCYEHLECLHYLQEKGCTEPTDEKYAAFFRYVEDALKQEQNRE